MTIIKQLARVAIIAVLVYLFVVAWRVDNVDGAPARRPQSTETWAALADCESGEWDRHRRPIPGTRRWHDRDDHPYYAGLHFHYRTWAANRAPDMPAEAWRADALQQVWVAEKVLAASSWEQQWPKCSKKIGVR